MAISMRKQIAQNKRNTIFIFVGFVLFIALIGALFSWLHNDWTLIIIFTAIAMGYATFQYFISGQLAIWSSGAHEIKEADNPRYYRTVQTLATEMHLPAPRIYIIEDAAPNAFAAGRDPEHARIAATTGLLDIMNDKELRAVVGHELSHIKNYDIRVSMIVFGLVAVVGLIADFGLRILFYNDRDENENSPIGLLLISATLVLAPVFATLAKLAISRQREYLADASSANAMNDSDSMINALRKLETHARPMRQQNVATEGLFIANPLKKSVLSGLFSTHPPIEKRIERLENAKK